MVAHPIGGHAGRGPFVGPRSAPENCTLNMLGSASPIKQAGIHTHELIAHQMPVPALPAQASIRA